MTFYHLHFLWCFDLFRNCFNFYFINWTYLPLSAICSNIFFPASITLLKLIYLYLSDNFTRCLMTASFWGCRLFWHTEEHEYQYVMISLSHSLLKWQTEPIAYAHSCWCNKAAFPSNLNQIIKLPLGGEIWLG